MYSVWVFVVRIELDNKLARVLYMLVARALITVPVHVERGVLILQQLLADLIVSITRSIYTRIGSLCVGVNNDDDDTAFCLLGFSHRIMIYCLSALLSMVTCRALLAAVVKMCVCATSLGTAYYVCSACQCLCILIFKTHVVARRIEVLCALLVAIDVNEQRYKFQACLLLCNLCFCLNL